VSPRTEEFLEQAREGGDYQAVTPSRDEAERYVARAGDFLAAVERKLGAT